MSSYTLLLIEEHQNPRKGSQQKGPLLGLTGVSWDSRSLVREVLVDTYAVSGSVVSRWVCLRAAP